MRFATTLALGLLWLAGSAASAADKQPSAKPDRKICRSEEVIGSIIPAHVCLTKAEWDKLAAHYDEQDKGFLVRRSEPRGVVKGSGGQ
jgi:hypothetical protein